MENKYHDYKVVWRCRQPIAKGKEEEIIQDYVNELSMVTISEKIGCSIQTISSILDKNNVPKRSFSEVNYTKDARKHLKPLYGKFGSQERLDEAIQLYNEGWDFFDLGKQYSISAVGLRLLFLRNNVQIRTKIEACNTVRYLQKRIDGIVDKYGVENPMQDPTIFRKSGTNRYKFKTHTTNGKTFTHLQGYEPQGIDYLIDALGYSVDDILTGSDVPSIKYKHLNKNKTYHPDIYIPKDELLVEIKCRYTYENQKDLNLSKKIGSLKVGYNYKTIIYNNLGTIVEEII